MVEWPGNVEISIHLILSPVKVEPVLTIVTVK
jgi:hypothetical protein